MRRHLEDRPIDRDERDIQLLRERDIRCVVCRQTSPDPPRDGLELRFDHIESCAIELIREFVESLRGPAQLAPGHVQELQEKKRGNCYRESSSLELSPKSSTPGLM